MKKIRLIACVLLVSIMFITSVSAMDYVPTNTLINFEADEVGSQCLTGGSGTPFTDLFNITFDLFDVINREPATIKAEAGNKYLSVDAYFVAEYIDQINGKYDFQVDMRTGLKEYLGGIFLHAENKLFNFFEWDCYKENGGASTTTNESFIGSSGIILVPVEKGLRIYVKTYESDGKISDKAYGVGNEYVQFDFSFDTNSKMFNIKVAEDKGIINVSLDGSALATWYYVNKKYKLNAENFHLVNL